MNGTGDFEFSPNTKVSLSQAVIIAARIRGNAAGDKETFENLDWSMPWYTPYVDYAGKENILKTSYADYEAVATRAQIAEIFANVLDGAEEMNTIRSIPDVSVSDSYGPAVYRLYRCGIMTGSDAGGTFNPNSEITRAEIAVIVARIIDPDLRVAASF